LRVEAPIGECGPPAAPREIPQRRRVFRAGGFSMRRAAIAVFSN
jgi:hypothetical protein